MRWSSGSLMVLVWLGALAPAAAQEAPAPDEQAEPSEGTEEASGLQTEARALFEAGQVAFDEGRFQNAVEYFRRSYELSQRPALLYNLALAADQARMDAEALAAYEEYLRREPNPPRRARVEARIEALRASIAAAESTPAPVVAPEPQASAGPDPAPWIVLGLSAAVLVTGAVLVGVAASEQSAVENAPMDSAWSDVAGAYSLAGPLWISGLVALGVGAAGLTASLVWALTAPSGSSEDASVALRVRGSSLSLEGRF